MSEVFEKYFVKQKDFWKNKMYLDLKKKKVNLEVNLTSADEKLLNEKLATPVHWLYFLK